MATDTESATDAILSTLKVQWDADTPALIGSVNPASLVFEQTEADLVPHPKDGTAAWARAVIRHADATKATLNNADGVARYRRTGLVWVQVFAPSGGGAQQYTLAQRLAMVAQRAYEGRRAASGDVVFTKAAIMDRAPDAAWFTFDVKVTFYWDELR